MKCEAGHTEFNPLCVACDSAHQQAEQKAEDQTYCGCWFCDNTGPMGTCLKCGKAPSPSRLQGEEEKSPSWGHETLARLKAAEHQRHESSNRPDHELDR